MDETTVTLHTPIRKGWMRRGHQRRVPAASGPQVFHHVIGALDWATDQVCYQMTALKNSQTFIEFLEHLLLKTYPDQTIVLVMDNAPYHRSAATQAVLSLFEHRLLVFWLPPYCPTLNPIERFWRHLKDLATANKLFLTFEHLVQNLIWGLDVQNDLSHPWRLSFSKAFA